MVILTDHNGFGGILSSELLQDWPDSFMGCRKVVEHTIRTESMLHALEQYDAKTIAEVSSTLRKKSDSIRSFSSGKDYITMSFKHGNLSLSTRHMMMRCLQRLLQRQR